MIPKFRAWDSVEKKFVEHFFITDNGLICNMEKPTSGYNSPIPVEKSELILMQSTGLFDKNGKEIFEGDIVKRYRNPLFKAEWEYQIETVVKREACLLLDKKFGKNSATMRFGSPFAKSDLLEVIGNVYQNPELLEVTE